METKKIQVPDSWDDVTIDQFQEISGLTTEDTDRTIDVISILIDEDPEIVRMFDLNTFSQLIGLLGWTNSMPNDAVYKTILSVEGEEYGMISKLTSLSIGEWIDLEHYVKSPIENIHFIMSILYRPLITAFNDRDRLIEEYDTDKMMRQASIFKSHVKITDVYGALVFFSIIEKEYIKIMQRSLEDLQVEMTMTS